MKYVRIFYQVLLFNLKSRLEYRWNFLVETLYGPAYVGVLYLLLQIAFLRSPLLLGWTQAEAALLFFSFHLLFSMSVMLYLGGVRHFLWSGIRHGELDLLLVKPIKTQFLVSVWQPELPQIVLASCLGGLLLRQLAVVQNQLTLTNTFSFIVLFVLAFCINYLCISIYATLGFYFTKAQQVLEIYGKITDHAQYPTGIYPATVQWLFFTLVPIGFMSYVPVSVLLGKLPVWWVVASFLFTLTLFFINRAAWQVGLRHYSSASS